MNNKFSICYYAALQQLIETELRKMPVIVLGHHGGRTVIRTQTTKAGRKHWQEIDFDKAKNTDIHLMMKRRSLLSSKLKETKGIINALTVEGAKIPNGNIAITNTSLFNRSLWDTLTPCMGPDNYELKYEYKGIKMRSRAEVAIAEIIDSLGLPFKYEPIITIGGLTFNPDFVVLLPAIDRILIIEYMGMCDSNNYVARNSGKLIQYFSSDFETPKHLLLFTGTSSGMTDTAFVKNSLIERVNSLTYEALGYNDDAAIAV